MVVRGDSHLAVGLQQYAAHVEAAVKGGYGTQGCSLRSVGEWVGGLVDWVGGVEDWWLCKFVACVWFAGGGRVGCGMQGGDVVVGWVGGKERRGYKAPHVPNHVPRVIYHVPHVPNYVPHVPNQAPHVTNQAPRVTNQAPHVTNQAPRVTNQRLTA